MTAGDEGRGGGAPPGPPRPETPPDHGDHGGNDTEPTGPLPPGPAMTRTHEIAAGLTRHRWTLLFGAAALLLVVLHLAGLEQAPPGLYSDEANAGYDGWAVAHFGIDQHGHPWPLLFSEAIGQYRDPVYVYAVAALTRLLPLTPAVERLPAALFGLAVCAMASLLAWHLSRDRSVTLVTLLTAGLLPWLLVESRVGFSVIAMVALLMLTLYAVARGLHGSIGWWLLAGVGLGASALAYPVGRLFAGLLTVVIVVAATPTRWPRRWRSVAVMTVPVALTYVLLYGWSASHPGVLTLRYGVLTINWDTPGLPTLAARFVGNYVQYLSVPFLLTHGDSNLRQNVGFGGMLAIASAPALLIGIAASLQRYREPLPRILLLGLLAAPVPAALTADGTPHALRAAAMLPFLLGLMIYGWRTILPALARRRTWAALLAGFAALEVGSFLFTLFVVWPPQALVWFDTGEGAALVRAHAMAHGHPVLISSSLDDPTPQVLFWLRPDPNRYARQGLSVENMAIVDPTTLATTAAPGDLMVLAPGDVPPPGSQLVYEASVTVTAITNQAGSPSQQPVVLVEVYRRVHR